MNIKVETRCQEHYLHGKHSLYGNPTRLHLIKKLKKKENYDVLKKTKYAFYSILN